jgi:hypothetical protein
MRYNDAFSIFFDDVQVGNYGILLPGTAIDTFNLGRYARGETLWGNTATPYVSITADLAPIKVAIAGDMSRVAFDETIVNNESYNKVGAAVRVSGDKIADLVSFDAIYKIHGGDDEIDEPPAAAGDQPDAHGIWGHNFGLVANLSLLDSLGIGIGYSGYAIAQEKGDATGDVNRKYVYPYFNGIDLRLEFTGLDKLTVDFNNNISFAAINGSADANIAVVSPWPRLNGTNLDADLSASYLGLYNALGVKFQVTDDLFANFGIQHRLDSATIEDKDADTTELFVSDNFRALLGAGYSFGDHVVLETGLVFNLNNTVTEITNGTNNLNGGTFTFAIPIRFKVELP